MKTIRMTVRHGNTNKSIESQADTLQGAMLAFKQTSLGGYAPAIESPRLPIVIASLETKGKAQLGWADYEVIN